MSPIHYVRTDKLPAVRAGAALNKSKLTTPPWPYLKYSFPTSPSPASIKLHLLLIPIPPPSDFPRALRALDLLVPPVVSENMYFILDYTATETVAELQVGGPEEGYRVQVSRLRREHRVWLEGCWWWGTSGRTGSLRARLFSQKNVKNVHLCCNYLPEPRRHH